MYMCTNPFKTQNSLYACINYMNRHHNSSALLSALRGHHSVVSCKLNSSVTFRVPTDDLFSPQLVYQWPPPRGAILAHSLSSVPQPNVRIWRIHHVVSASEYGLYSTIIIK